jgi:cytochrome c5
MRKSERTKWGLCFGTMGALVVAGLATLSVPRPVTAAPTEAPTEAAGEASRGAQRTPTPTQGGNQLAVGRQRYDRVCGRCHPGGEEDVGPRLRDLNWAEDRMVRTIREGTGRMRPIAPSKLPDADMPALMTFLRSMRAVR